jgi:hypothetical protein
MKTFNKTLIAAATLTTFGLAAAPAAVALDASAEVATSYLWRGAEQDTGDAAVSVDLSSSAMGVTYGIWISSGAGQTEHDYYASYSGSFGALGYEVGMIDYNYQDPNGDMEETYVSLSYGSLSLSQYENSDSIADYTVASYTNGPFTLSHGEITNDQAVDTSHTDLSYTVNDKLTLTISDTDATDETIFVASYSLPF